MSHDLLKLRPWSDRDPSGWGSPVLFVSTHEDPGPPPGSVILMLLKEGEAISAVLTPSMQGVLSETFALVAKQQAEG